MRQPCFGRKHGWLGRDYNCKRSTQNVHGKSHFIPEQGGRTMPVIAIVGAQWGDEGKGRVVDYLASSWGESRRPADMVIRYQGGDNAGHTVLNRLGEFKLHLVPSGIFNPGTRCIVGTGCVVNPDTLLAEMDALRAAGVSLENLIVSGRA